MRGERGSRDSLGTRLRSGREGGGHQVVFGPRYFFALFPHSETWCPTGPRLSREKKKAEVPLSLLLCIIYLHNFTFSLAALCSEERKTTARGLAFCS